MYSYKLCNVVDIPEELDLTEFVSQDAHPDGDKEPHDTPKMLQPDELQQLEHDLAKLQVGFLAHFRICKCRVIERFVEKAGDFADDPKEAERIKKRQMQHVEAKRIDAMVQSIPDTLSRSNVKYDLFGVCHHTGSIKAGHYYAYIKGPKTAGDGECCRHTFAVTVAARG